MALRPYWSGQIRISLISFAVTLQSATRRSSQVPLHELYRKTGERIHHQNITEDGTVVDREDIVKGYEVVKGEHIPLEPEEIDNIKLPSSDTLELGEFADIADIPMLCFERPYFLLPTGRKSEEIYDVIAEVLRSDKKAGIGQISLHGREELCAILPYKQGLIAETLRYATELEEAPDLFVSSGQRKNKAEHITLARQLIREYSHPLDLREFHDHYHEALLELIDAKQKHRRPRRAPTRERPAEIVDFAEALRRSLKSKSGNSNGRANRPPARKHARG